MCNYLRTGVYFGCIVVFEEGAGKALNCELFCFNGNYIGAINMASKKRCTVQSGCFYSFEWLYYGYFSNSGNEGAKYLMSISWQCSADYIDW